MEKINLLFKQLPDVTLSETVHRQVMRVVRLRATLRRLIGLSVAFAFGVTGSGLLIVSSLYREDAVELLRYVGQNFDLSLPYLQAVLLMFGDLVPMILLVAFGLLIIGLAYWLVQIIRILSWRETF